MTVTHRIKLGQGTWDSAINVMRAQVPVNVGNIDRRANEADVQGRNDAQITTYLQQLTTNDFQPTDLGNVVEPPPEPPLPQPTPDEITRDEQVKTAFDTMMVNEIARLDALAIIEYDAIKTTTEPYLRKFDIKHLRQRA
jgi:hypothetical protein